MVGLPDGEKILRICVTILKQYWRVTDRRTDTLWRHSPCYAYVSRGKNDNKIGQTSVDGLIIVSAEHIETSVRFCE